MKSTLEFIVTKYNLKFSRREEIIAFLGHNDGER